MKNALAKATMSGNAEKEQVLKKQNKMEFESIFCLKKVGNRGNNV